MLVSHASKGQLAPEEGESKPSPSLRAWIFPGSEKANVVVTLTDAAKAEKKVLASSSSGAAAIDEAYAAVTEGQHSLEVRIGEKVESAAEVNLRDSGAFTAVFWKTDGKWVKKVFRDNAQGDSDTREARLMNFADGRDSLVAINGSEGRRVPASTVEAIPAPPKISLLTVEVPDPTGGPPAKSSVEVDFSLYRNAYVIIAPDYRGRMRPRIFPAGKLREDEPTDFTSAGENPPLNP